MSLSVRCGLCEQRGGEACLWWRPPSVVRWPLAARVTIYFVHLRQRFAPLEMLRVLAGRGEQRSSRTGGGGQEPRLNEWRDDVVDSTPATAELARVSLLEKASFEIRQSVRVAGISRKPSRSRSMSLHVLAGFERAAFRRR